MSTENTPADDGSQASQPLPPPSPLRVQAPPKPAAGFDRNIGDVITSIPWKKLLSWIIASNPFFLLSALFMLQGIYLVSVDPQMFGEEQSQLAFNFSSLQVYELMLVLTALFLARRQLWHDTALLFWLENLFVFVPFILISQASMLENRKVWVSSLCAAATLFTVLRFSSWKIYLRPLNLPLPALALGVALLLANLFFPLHFRAVIAEDSLAWTRLSPLLWNLLLPALTFCLLLLPRSEHQAERSLARRWTPLAAAFIWFTATAVHLRSLDYLDGIRFHYWMLAPLLWSAAWVLHFRLGDVIQYNLDYRTRVLALPVIATGLAITYEQPHLFLTLTAANCLILGGLLWRDAHDRAAKEFLFASIAATVAALPAKLGDFAIPDFSREKLTILALGAYLFLLACRSRSLRGAVIGAILCGGGTQYLLAHFDYAEQLALQNALLFGLAHSLFWQGERSALANAWWKAFALALPLHSFAWGRIAGTDAAMMIALASLFIFGVAYLAGQLSGVTTPRLLPLAATANLGTIGLNYSVDALRITPTGYLVVLSAFLLFAGGIAYALLRERWVKNGPATMNAKPAVG